jgi:hypothetical protein
MSEQIWYIIVIYTDAHIYFFSPTFLYKAQIIDYVRVIVS